MELKTSGRFAKGFQFRAVCGIIRASFSKDCCYGSVSAREKLAQELAVFRSIRDNYPKYLLTLDEVFVPDHDGVKTLNVIDFLLGKVGISL